jgi:hypothetical protein
MRLDGVTMEILGSIQGDSMEIPERERMQRQMRDLIARLERVRSWNEERVAYKVHFSRPLFGTRVDSLIEFRAGGQESWYARANGGDPWKAFCKAMGSLKQIVTEIEMREEKNEKNGGDAA